MDMALMPTLVGLRRIMLKDLEPDLDNILIIGVIIRKQEARKFPDKNEENEYRAVWNFTLRDSQRDYINVSLWGQSQEVCAISEKFFTGDVVEIRNPRISVRRFNENNEQFVPMVTSPFNLTLNEYQIFNYDGELNTYTKLLNLPTKPLSGYVPFKDIQKGGENMKERIIDILGILKSVGPIKNIKTKLGKEMEMREIVLFDHTNTGLRVTLWDSEFRTRAAIWRPGITILFITDTKINWSTFLSAYSASATSRSVITENPLGREAIDLANYAKTAPLHSIDQFIFDLPNPDTIQNVVSIRQIHNKINNFTEQISTSEPQICGILYATVTQFDLDGPIPVIKVKCSSCKTVLQNTLSPCINPECNVVKGVEDMRYDTSFEIKVNLSDHTGTLINCKLSGSIAEDCLGCSVSQFIRMSDEQKRKLKWKYLMERCTAKIVVLIVRRIRRTTIVSLKNADPIETIQKIPLC